MTFPNGYGPIPAYTNPPINPQYYQPRVYTISSISLGATTTITTSVDNDYIVGQLCRLIIPENFGCYQLNEQEGYVISIPAANQVVLTINSMMSDAFVTPSFYRTKPQILAIGDVNTGYLNSSGRSSVGINVPGSFLNISPA